MSKAFIAQVLQESADLTGIAANRAAGRSDGCGGEGAEERGQVHPAKFWHLHRAQDQGAQGSEPTHRQVDKGQGRQDGAFQGIAVAEEIGLIRQRHAAHHAPRFRRAGGGARHAGGAIQFVGQLRLPLHHPRIRVANPGDPVGHHRLYADLRGIDAGVRPGRRHARLSANFSRGKPVERGRVCAVCHGAQLRRLAGRAGASGRGCRIGIELRACAGDQPPSGSGAHARSSASTPW